MEVLNLLWVRCNKLRTLVRMAMLSVAAGLLVRTRFGPSINVTVTMTCRPRLFENRRGQQLT